MKLDDDSSFDSEANQCELEKSVSEENKEFSEQNNLINDSFNNDFISKPQNTPNTENKATFATFVDKSSIVNKFLEQKSERKISLKKTDIIKKSKEKTYSDDFNLYIEESTDKFIAWLAN